MGEGAPRLDGVEFGVLALGDTAYVEFCAIGKALDERLAALGGKRVVERVDCDLDFAEPAAKWIGDAVKILAPPEAERGTVISVDFGAKAASADLGPVEAEITEHINLNSSQSDKETVHLELTFDGAAPAYKPGDSLDIYAENDPAYVDALLKAAGFASDESLRSEFLKNRDVTTLSLKTLETYAASTGHQYVKALLESGEAKSWIAGRQLIDLIEQFPIALSAEQLRALTRPLAPRAYSIASSRREVGEEAHLLISAVRYESHGRARKGRCLELRRRAAEEGQSPARQAQAQQAFRAARARPRHHHGGARHRRRAVPRLRAGAPREQRQRTLVAVLRRPQLHPRLPVSARMAGCAEGRRAHPHGRRVLARPAGEGLRPAPHLGAAPRPRRLARQGRVLLRLRRHERDGEGRARDAGARFADVKALTPEAAEQAVRDIEREKRYLQDVY